MGRRPREYKQEFCDQVIEYGKKGKSITWMAAEPGRSQDAICERRSTECADEDMPEGLPLSFPTPMSSRARQHAQTHDVFDETAKRIAWS
jgi:hypothetical protein